MTKDMNKGMENFEDFLAECPGYEETDAIDRLRAEEYSRLDSQGHVYLDYTGGGLYSDLQIRKHMDLLLGNVLGLPTALALVSHRHPHPHSLGLFIPVHPIIRAVSFLWLAAELSCR